VGSSDSSKQGSLVAISVTPLPGGRFAGWAAGTFGAAAVPAARNATDTTLQPGTITKASPGLLRLDPDHQSSWQRWQQADAASDYLVDSFKLDSAQLLSEAAPDGQERSFLLPPPAGVAAAAEQSYPLLEFDGARQRWRVLPTPWLASAKQSDATDRSAGQVDALVPDGAGGLWLAAASTSISSDDGTARSGYGAYFYHYTDRQPPPVFSDVAHPVREPIAGTAAGADGSFWVATESSVLYRYDRLTGWDRMTIPGWDPGRIVSRSLGQ
jgi:hypothetical protein